MGLQRYREMRDFSRTPEPKGKPSGRQKNESLSYYVQRHAARRLHYDFRLELDGVLKSWAVPKGPSLDPADKRLAVQTEDHPLEYGEFEGVIPEKQYGAGDVLLWDRGTWTPEDRDPREALRKGRLHFSLDGEKLQGRWVLAKTKGDWLLIKRNDDEARPDVDITMERPESVKRPAPRAKRAKKAPLPQFVSPQLATLVGAPPAAGKWVYEVKHDGYRMLARITQGDVRLFTRAGNDWTAKLPHLKKALEKLGLEDSWLDGEIVVLAPDGRASFQRLQNAFDARSDAGITYFVFAPSCPRHRHLEHRLCQVHSHSRTVHRVPPSSYWPSGPCSLWHSGAASREESIPSLGADASVSLVAIGVRLAAHASRSAFWLAQLKPKSLGGTHSWS